MTSRASRANDASPVDVPAACAGDSAAAARLLTALVPRTRHLVRYLIRGDGDVDDVAQEALVAVLRGLPSYRGEGAFHSWADRVVARATFAWLERRKALEYQAFELLEECREPDEASTSDRYLERRRVARALDELPFEQRQAMVLHHVLEMSVPEIAEQTHAPHETVRSRLRLGRGRLRDALTLSAHQKMS